VKTSWNFEEENFEDENFKDVKFSPSKFVQKNELLLLKYLADFHMLEKGL
jgi:hypothetical protein